MDPVSYGINQIQELLLFLTWRDVLEIIFLTFMTYRFMQWLSIDQQKPLIGYFYSYYLICIGAYYLQLTTITVILTAFLPFSLIALCILHQQTLQKNFITLKKIALPIKSKEYWLEELLRASVHALHKQKEIVCIIEKKDSLIEYFKIPYFFNAEITADLLDILIDSSVISPTLLLINAQGTLISLNPLFNRQIPAEHYDPDQHLSSLEQQLIFITTKTDALIFRSHIHHFFSLYSNDTVIEKLRSAQLIMTLKKYLSAAKVPYEKSSSSSFTQSAPY